MSGLEVEGVRTSRGEFQLGPVSFGTAPGAASVVLGPSGAGKTSLLRSIAGFLPLTSGRVRLDGADLTDLAPERRRFGFVPPGLGLFPHRRVDANVGYALELAGDPAWRSRAREWLERFGLLELARRFPPQLSSGERQRVALARALAAGPRLLLWDEPLSALDVERRDELLLLLRGVLEEERIPLVLVTHDPSTAFSLADRYVQIDAGARVFEGSSAEYLAHPTDSFHARFLGYENVWSRAELERAAPRSDLAGALLRLAGPEGMAYPAGGFQLGTGAAPFAFRAERWQPTPDRTIVWGHSGGLRLRAAIAGPPPAHPAQEWTVSYDERVVRPLTAPGAAR